MLRHNCSILTALPLRYLGGDPGTLRTMFGHAERMNVHVGEGLTDKKAAVPNGHLAPSAWILPMKGGGMSSYVGNLLILDVAPLNLASGRNIEGSASITLALADADLQLIVSASGEATFTLTGDATLAGALYAAGVADLSISVSAATLGAIVDAIGTASASLSGDGTATALGHMSGTTEVVDELSPTALATAVWQRVIEAGYTAEQVLRIVAAHAAGAATGLESGNPQFVGLDGSTVRIDGAYSAGTRTIDALNGG